MPKISSLIKPSPNLIIGAVTAASFLLYWNFETNLFLKIALLLLFVFALWRLSKQDSAPLLFTVGFIAAAALFKLSDAGGGVSSSWATFIIFVLILLLFSYRHSYKKHRHFASNIFSAYTSLLALLIGEVFYTLTFFNIEAKNKAIIIVLWLWFYDELVDALESGRLDSTFIKTVGLVFSALFIAVALTMNFSQRL